MQEIATALIVSFHSILPFNLILSFHPMQLIYLFRHGTICKIKSVNTKLLIQAFLQIILILIHLCSSLVIFTILSIGCILLDMMKGNIFISKVCAPFESLLHTYSEKSELSWVLWSKISRKWKDCQKIHVFFCDCRTITKGKSQNICLFFTETSSTKQYREWLLAVISREWKNE